MTTKELNDHVFAYILDAISPEAYEATATTDAEKLAFLRDTFLAEYGWQVARIGVIPAMREWMMGLPSCYNVDFENYRIIELAKEWGSIPSYATERQEQKILDNWFNLIANKTVQLAKRHKVFFS